MKKATLTALTGKGFTKYTGILLDSVDNFYTYQPSIPVYRLGKGLRAIGQALLKKSKHQLFCDLVILKEADCRALYPHIVFDCKGKIYAVMLLCTPSLDLAVRPLDDPNR